MRTLSCFGMLLLLISNWGCTKKLEGDVSNLQAQLEAINLELASMKTSRADLDLIITQLQHSNANFEALYNSEFIGCWYTVNSALRGVSTEIQIFPGGVGSLDFGGGVYQVFSWSQVDGVTALHFGDVLYCSCFGVDYNFVMDSAQILYGEMFDQDHYPVIQRKADDSEYFELTDWSDYDVVFDRCIIN